MKLINRCLFLWLISSRVFAKPASSVDADVASGASASIPHNASIPDVTVWRQFGVHVLGNTAVFENVLVYCFGVFVVSLEYSLLKKSKASAEDILRVFTITLVIILSLTMLTSGSETAEYTPIIGLFGTIIGYLLGAKQNAPRSPTGNDRGDGGDANGSDQTG